MDHQIIVMFCDVAGVLARLYRYFSHPDILWHTLFLVFAQLTTVAEQEGVELGVALLEEYMALHIPSGWVLG
jgi:hypothetical protein